jgi:hypothetical protein
VWNPVQRLPLEPSLRAAVVAEPPFVYSTGGHFESRATGRTSPRAKAAPRFAAPKPAVHPGR